MRGARLLLPILAALAVSACARQQPTYYVVDPASGQPVPVMTQQQQFAQPQYAQQTNQQPTYQPPTTQPQSAASGERGLFNARQSARQGYVQPQYAQPAYQQSYQPPVAQPQSAASSGRGLFNARQSARQAYVQQPAQQPYVMQYTAPQNTAPQYAAPQYGAGGPPVAAPYGYASAPANYQQPYTLDAGDRLRIVVFGQEGISNSYFVDAAGNVNLPLVGVVPARGYTTQQLSQMLVERLKQGYVREPHVSVEVEAYRPFFILGEVTNPGQYPYVANMTAEKAVAIAGGFAPRADKRVVKLTRNAPGQQINGDVPLGYPLRPGDTVVVKERWF
jgi:polysaccharide export outer membrane protein